MALVAAPPSPQGAEVAGLHWVPLPATVVMRCAERIFADHVIARVGDVDVSGSVQGHGLRAIQIAR